MPGPVAREEFDELADEVAGEKTISRHILEQTRRNGDDLAALKTRVGRVEEKVDGLTRDVTGLKGDVAGLKTDVAGLKTEFGSLRADFHGLRDALPGIVAETMREVLREAGRKH